jgi:nicotinamide-nucleotide amidase
VTPATASSVVAELARRGHTVAVAESLTGGLVVAELVSVPGASAVVHGGVVAYATELKHSLLGVSAEQLAATGPVDPDVAAAMAAGVRERLVVAGAPATVGLSTTGVAGPGPQDGLPAGTVYVALATADGSRVRRLDLVGDRGAIRSGTVSELLSLLAGWLDETRE